MSITKRILEGAQSSLSRLTSLVIVDDEPLSHVEGAALQAELAARKAARERAGASATNPWAKLATSDPAARAARDKAARERAARIHRERDEREAKQRAAADEAFRRMKDEAARGGSTWSSASSSSSSTSSSGTSSSSTSSSGTSSSGARSNARPPRPGSAAANLAEWYRVLDVDAGADLAQIKSAYRRAMRKYHPDMHAGNPQKQKAATELSMRVTTAYNGLVSHLERK